MELKSFGVLIEVLRFWMPPACPGELPVFCYTRGYLPSSLPPFPRGGEAAAGEWGGTLGGAVCSENRNDPPGKPGAFVRSQCEHGRCKITFGASASRADV